MKIHKNNTGFTPIMLIMALVIICLLGAVGWLVYKDHNKQSTSNTAVTKSIPEKSIANRTGTASNTATPTSPTCTAPAITAAIQQYSPGFTLSSNGYACSGDYAYAYADSPNTAAENGASESTYIFKANGDTWQYAGDNAGKDCTDMLVPASIYQNACDTN